MRQHLPKQLLRELRRTHLVGVGETVARRPYRRPLLQAQPIAHVIESKCVRQLRGEHRTQMTEHTKVPRLRLGSRLPRHLADQASRNILEQLRENDNIGAGWWCCFFHTLPRGRDPEPPPAHFSFSSGTAVKSRLLANAARDWDKCTALILPMRPRASARPSRSRWVRRPR